MIRTFKYSWTKGLKEMRQFPPGRIKKGVIWSKFTEVADGTEQVVKIMH
ncbi:MAG: hypothetical protein CM15mV60_160 [uncultured marine virus]|nr:MAG: hypothetical protein CM15mV60_160 [uncultured marine virus]